MGNRGEIFPGQTRELGMGISAAIGWMCSVTVMTAFPVISAAVGQAIPFFVMALIGLLSSIFVVLFLVYTCFIMIPQRCKCVHIAMISYVFHVCNNVIDIRCTNT